MELYILRHGIAEDGETGQPDSARALTPEGKKRLRPVLRLAQKAGVCPTLILSSPYRRALETAELAAKMLHYKGEVLRSKTLTPASPPASVWDEIRVHKSEAQLLLAGHEPLFSSLTAYLLASPNLQIDFKKGAIARIDFDSFGPQPRGVLKWMLLPKLGHD
jgi:phosphohistidine phosphatase